MSIKDALKILQIVHLDICGITDYDRCLSYTPTKAEIDEAMRMIEIFVGNIIYAK